MTDIPALSGELVSLAVGIAGLGRTGRRRDVLVGVSVAIGVFGFAIREFDVAAPATVVAPGALSERGPRRWGYLAGGALPTWHPSFTGPAGAFRAFAVLVCAGFALYTLVAPKIFDRYFWAVDLSVAVLLLAGPARTRPPAGAGPGRARPPRGVARSARRAGPGAVAAVAATAVLLAFVSVALTVDSDAYDAARWQAGQIAVERGVPAGEVDAGFEWLGAHHQSPIDLSLQARPAPPLRAVVRQDPPRLRGLRRAQRDPGGLARAAPHLGGHLRPARRRRPDPAVPLPGRQPPLLTGPGRLARRRNEARFRTWRFEHERPRAHRTMCTHYSTLTA